MRTNRRRALALAACGLAALALAPFAADAQAVRVPRTTISIVPPPGFKVARSFSGLENEETGSQIMLAESPPAARAELVAAFSSPRALSQRYASQGIRITRIEQVSVAEGSIPLAIGGRAQNGKEVVTYLSTMGGPATSTMAVLITFSIAPMDTLTRADVEATLRSIRLERVLTLDERIARLSFAFEAAAPFEVTSVQETSVTLTSADDQGSVEKTPMIVIGRAQTTSAPGEIVRLSETLLGTIPRFRDAPIAERAEMPFAGGTGYLVAAQSGALTALQLVRVMPGGRYIRFAARGETGAMDAARETLLAIASTVELKE